MESEQAIVRRAWRAYQKAAGDSLSPARQPVERLCAIRALDGLQYVTLSDERGTLAVYRVRNDGALKRLKCWPIELGREIAEAA